MLHAEDAPAPADHTLRPRHRRGPLEPIDVRPEQRVRTNKNGVHRFRVNPRKLEPGRYRVVCRAVDKTQLRGERHPWVLRDPAGLLASERGWWLEVR